MGLNHANLLYNEDISWDTMGIYNLYNTYFVIGNQSWFWSKKTLEPLSLSFQFIAIPLVKMIHSYRFLLRYHVWLVVWMPFFIFRYIGLLIIPIE